MLFLDRSVGGSAANRKVVAADNHLPTIDFGPSEDKIRRRQFFEVVVIVIFRKTRDFTEFAEGIGISHLLDTFPNRQATAVFLAFHSFGTTEFLRKGLAAFQFFEFRLPRHIRSILK